MPDATFQSDLNNLDRFYQHIGTHAESWYRYANGPDMGRRLDNSGICLVIGCDKTNSWGIATFSDSTEQTTSRLQFLPVASSSGGDSGCSYTWEHSGTAHSPRVGPSRREPLGQSSRNQCLFLRYLTFKLRKRTFGFRGTTEVQIQMRSHQSTSPGTMQLNSPNPGSSRTLRST